MYELSHQALDLAAESSGRIGITHDDKHRVITGDGAKRDLVAPLWSADKKRVLNYLHKVLDIQP